MSEWTVRRRRRRRRGNWRWSTHTQTTLFSLKDFLTCCRCCRWGYPNTWGDDELTTHSRMFNQWLRLCVQTVMTKKKLKKKKSESRVSSSVVDRFPRAPLHHHHPLLLHHHLFLFPFPSFYLCASRVCFLTNNNNDGGGGCSSISNSISNRRRRKCTAEKSAVFSDVLS